MIWRSLSTEVTVQLPRQFNAYTMYRFVAQVVNEQREASAARVNFDFSVLEFIEPVGVVVLSNLIEHLKQTSVKVYFQGHTNATFVLKYLDDSGFFRQYLKQSLFPDSSVRDTTVPLKLIKPAKAAEFLYFKLMPWIARCVGREVEVLASLRASLEEILHNVKDHSGTGIGCAFAQHFPNKSTIQIAISDFGRGIPDLVRTQVPGLSDSAALRQACAEGFTTKSNVQNRGAGLPTLMRYVTDRVGGNVLLAAGRGELSASSTPAASGRRMKLTARSSDGFYPGTLVRVILRTESFGRVVEDAEPETFKW